jgi:hydroxyacylglutathione hydrolase
MLTRFKSLEFGQRMYAVSNDIHSIIFDPGYLSEDVLVEVTSRVEKPKAIFLTHGHFDHLNGVPQIQKVFGDIPIFMSPLDEPLLKQNRLLQFVTKSKTVPFLLENYLSIEDPLSKTILDKFKIKTIPTPGHTPGSTCFIYDRVLISGDTLIRGEIGPTMLPGGNPVSMRQTLLKLKASNEFDTIAPGHGDFFSKLELEWAIDGL